MEYSEFTRGYITGQLSLVNALRESAEDRARKYRAMETQACDDLSKMAFLNAANVTKLELQMYDKMFQKLNKVMQEIKLKKKISKK